MRFAATSIRVTNARTSGTIACGRARSTSQDVLRGIVLDRADDAPSAVPCASTSAQPTRSSSKILAVRPARRRRDRSHSVAPTSAAPRSRRRRPRPPPAAVPDAAASRARAARATCRPAASARSCEPGRERVLADAARRDLQLAAQTEHAGHAAGVGLIRPSRRSSATSASPACSASAFRLSLVLERDDVDADAPFGARAHERAQRLRDAAAAPDHLAEIFVLDDQLDDGSLLGVDLFDEHVLGLARRACARGTRADPWRAAARPRDRRSCARRGRRSRAGRRRDGLHRHRRPHRGVRAGRRAVRGAAVRLPARCRRAKPRRTRCAARPGSTCALLRPPAPRRRTGRTRRRTRSSAALALLGLGRALLLGDRARGPPGRARRTDAARDRTAARPSRATPSPCPDRRRASWARCADCSVRGSRGNARRAASVASATTKRYVGCFLAPMRRSLILTMSTF